MMPKPVLIEMATRILINKKKKEKGKRELLAKEASKAQWWIVEGNDQYFKKRA